MTLILHTLHLLIQKLSHIKGRYCFILYVVVSASPLSDILTSCSFPVRSLLFTPKSLIFTPKLFSHIELPSDGNKIGFNLLDDEYFTIPYVIDIIPNSPAGHKVMTHTKKYVWIIYDNGEKPMKHQGALDELQHHKTQRGKSEAKISLCRSNIYQQKYIEDIWYIFDQVRPVVSHPEVRLPENNIPPKKIGDAIKGPHR